MAFRRGGIVVFRPGGYIVGVVVRVVGVLVIWVTPAMGVFLWWDRWG